VAGTPSTKLVRALRGRDVTVSHGLAQSLAQLAAEPGEFTGQATAFMDQLLGHVVLDDGRLVVAHAGLPESMHGRASAAVRSFALYGDTSGETDEFGLPVRYPWAQDYRGRAMVAYGHTPVPAAEWVNGTICLDTGCVFGGRLTALRYPEREIVSVPARQVYFEPVRPLGLPAAVPAREAAELNITDVLGKRIVSTRLTGQTVTIREENALAALEVMSRFALDPRWLVYLPPTMSPTAAAGSGALLEHPRDAFAAYRSAGVAQVVAQEKHMGSRAVVIVCRDPEVGARQFGVAGSGVIYTRTGRAFFADPAVADEVLDRVRAAVGAAGLWAELDTDWLVLDAELLPWSAKAVELLRGQYAPVAAAATTALDAAAGLLAAAAARGVDGTGELLAGVLDRRALAGRFADAYRRYCWPVESVADLRLAPFQVLAGAGRVHALRPHAWHLDVLGRLCAADPGFFRVTRTITVTLADPASEAAATDWWLELTAGGGEGMVVKPAEASRRGPRGIAQPGIKCRGPEYLRIIYGPEYSIPAHLARLRVRNVGRKRALALREFALGIEALERFVAAEPLYRVHECVFGVLALESEPVDPRL
jgi:protein phosphatase